MTGKLKFIDKFLITSALVAVGIVASWGIAMARLSNPTSVGANDNITVLTLTATTGTFSNLTVTVLASSSQYDYLPVNTTSRAARVLIQGASTENPLQITSSTGGSMLSVLQNGRLDVVGATAGLGGRALVVSDNNSLLGAVFSFGWTGGGVGNKYKSFFVDGNGINLGTENDSLSGAPASQFNISNAGNVGINSTTPNFNLSVSGTVAFPHLVAPTISSIFVCSEADGQLRRQATNCTASSARFKENIYSMSPKDLMEKVRKLRAIGFDFKNGRTEGTNGGGKESEGFLAEEVAMIDPMLVSYTDQYSAADLAWEKKYYPKAILYKNGKALIPQTVDYARVSVLLVGGLQFVDEKNQEQDRELKRLNDKLTMYLTGKTPAQNKYDWMWKSLTSLAMLASLFALFRKK